MTNLRQQPALVLVALAVFLAPLLGGQLGLDPIALAPGSWLAGALGGLEAPLGSHFLISIPAFIALAICLSRRVLQLPTTSVGGPLAAYFGLTVLSIAVSTHRWQSLVVALEWLTYAVVFIAVVASVGRKFGPTLILGSMALGGSILAMKALQEFAQTRAAMFAGWNNPNALAAMLLIGFFCCLGLSISAKSSPALPALGAVIIGFAILLTSSQGALLAFIGALVLFFVCGLVWGNDRKSWFTRSGIVALLVVGLSFGLQASQSRSAGNAPAVAGNDTTAVQSVGFRKALFSTSFSLIKVNPVGYGAGGFRFVSAKPGQVTGTVLAHNNVLQAAVDTSPASALALVIAGLVWVARMFRGAKALPQEQAGLRAGVLCAVAAVFAHGMVDSTFSYFGVGFTFFALVGLGLLLASDSVAPEAVPKLARATFLTLLVLVTASQVVVVRGEALKNNAQFGLETQNAEVAIASANAATSWTPTDGLAWWQLAQVSSPESRLSAIQTAAKLCPQPRFFRAIAREETALGKPGNAISALDEALLWDPNNLPALAQKMELLRSGGSEDRAVDVAKRLIEVESTPYFTIRSLPELVPLETYRARVFLASKAKERSQRLELLTPALKGYEAYAKSTLPKIRDFAKAGLTGFGGESVPDAIRAMQEGLSILTQLRKDGYSPADLEEGQRALTEGLAGLEELK